MTVAIQPCGSYGAYQRHKKRGETPCEECRTANATYHRERLRWNPDIRADERMRNAARSRAVWRLADEYPERFRQLFIEEVTRDG